MAANKALSRLGRIRESGFGCANAGAEAMDRQCTRNRRHHRRKRAHGPAGVGGLYADRMPADIASSPGYIPLALVNIGDRPADAE